MKTLALFVLGLALGGSAVFVLDSYAFSEPQSRPVFKYSDEPPKRCKCKSAPGGVGTCGSFKCPANGGTGDCECEYDY